MNKKRYISLVLSLSFIISLLMGVVPAEVVSAKSEHSQYSYHEQSSHNNKRAEAPSSSSSHYRQSNYHKQSSAPTRTSSSPSKQQYTTPTSSNRSYANASPSSGPASSNPMNQMKQKNQQNQQTTEHKVASQTKLSTSTARGNNGTVKIDGAPYSTKNNNEPHVGCDFQTKYFNYDAGAIYSNAIFSAHAPTGSGALKTDRVFVGEDAAMGGRDLDASPAYNLRSSLSSYNYHPKQGYHIKLASNNESVPGGAKQKVFWVQCQPTISTTRPEPPQGGKGGDKPVTTVKIAKQPAHEKSIQKIVNRQNIAALKPASVTVNGTLPFTGAKENLNALIVMMAVLGALSVVYWRQAVVPKLSYANQQ